MPRTLIPVLTACALLAALISSASCSHQERAAEATKPVQTSPPAQPKPTPMPSADSEDTTQQISLGAGCFWCIEAIIERLPGVVGVESGYMGGSIDNPTYEQICTGRTGHAEVVKVRFDPKQMTLAQLLDWFFQAHDPTTLNQQGPDRGTQYRSAIFYHDEKQREAAEQAKAAAAKLYSDPIVTEITAAPTFWPAEAYHQDFFANNPANPYCRAWIPPKLKKLGLTDQDK